jgi:hypothetical protein
MVIGIGYLLFFSRIPQTLGISNLRFLFPASYVFWGILAAHGADRIARLVSGKIRPNVAIPVIMGVYLCFSLPSIGWEIQQKLPKQQDYRDPLVYLAADAAAGFGFLEIQRDYEAIVLANPKTHMDTHVPAITGHTTFSGHQLTSSPPSPAIRHFQAIS